MIVQAQAAPTPEAQVTLNGSSRPLELQVRREMEERLGHDCSKVKVPNGLAAEQSDRDVNAHAYTVGSNIVFGSRQQHRAQPRTFHAGERWEAR